MRLATILIVALLLGAFVNQQKEDPVKDPVVIEVQMLDEKLAPMGTALIPQSLAKQYREIEFYDGTTPPPGTDFDIIEIPMKEGGGVYMLCVR